MNKKAKNILLFFFIFALSVGVGIILGKSGMKIPSIEISPMAILYVVLSLFLSLILLINLHELGHFFFGKIAGYKLYMYQAGPLALRNMNGKYRFEWGKSQKGLGGFCMMIPPERGTSKRENLLYYAGGILVNLLTGAMALFILYFVGGVSAFWYMFLSTFGWLSILVAITNAIPMTTGGGVANDGKIIFSLFSNNAYARNLIRIMRVQQMMVVGIRPGEIEELVQDEVNEEIVEGSENFTVIWNLSRLFAALDNQDEARMRSCLKLIERDLEQIPALTQIPTLYELCSSYCLLGEPERARTYYERVASDLEKDKDLNGNRVKAYYAFYVLQDPGQAELYCQKALEVADKYPLKGQALLEKDLIARLREKIQSVHKNQNKDEQD